MNITDFITYYCQSIQGCLQGLYNLGVALAVVLAFFMFLFGAFKNLLSTLPDVKADGKNMMKNAILGLVVIFISGTLLYWINPFIFEPVISIYRISSKVLEIKTVDVNQNFQAGSNSYNLNLKDINTDELNQKGCLSPHYKIRTTVYYIPFLEEEPTRHKGISNATLQGKIITKLNVKEQYLNSLTAQEILKNIASTSNKEIDKCKQRWHWSWIKIADKPSRCPLAKSNYQQSTQNNIVNNNQWDQLIKNKAQDIKGSLKGAYSYVIPGKTAAHNPNHKIFQKMEAIKILKCLDSNFQEKNCGIKNKVFIITDTGGGESAGSDGWLDLFAGFGENQLNSFANQKTEYAEVCVIAENIKLK
jgi:hypothetical protein